MPLIDTPDGKDDPSGRGVGHYTHAVTTANEGDGNDVVYDNWINPGQQTPVWDKFSYETQLGRMPRPAGPGTDRPPDPVQPLPAVPSVGGRVGDPIRVTDESDGTLINRGYSYYPQAWISEGAIYCFTSHADGHPRFFKVDLSSGAVTRLGPKLQFYTGGEGWYWDMQGWIYLCDGPRLLRVNPWTLERQIVFDISDTHPGCRIFQSHSSDDGQTHSATVQRIVEDGPYPNIATVIFKNGKLQPPFPAIGDLDESQPDATGGWVVIKETRDGLLCNRIIDLVSRVTRTLTNATGAVGHSDCGPGIVVGEWSPQNGEDVGQCVRVDLRTGKRLKLFATDNLGHVSVRAGRCLISDSKDLYLAGLDGEDGGRFLLEHGMVVPPDTPDWKKYDYQVMANLSPCGRVAAYLSNAAGRMDLYLLVLS